MAEEHGYTGQPPYRAILRTWDGSASPAWGRNNSQSHCYMAWRNAAGYDAIRNLSKGLQDFATDNRIFEASMLILVCGRRCGSAGLPLSPHNFLGVKIALGDGQLAAGTLLLDLGGTMLDDVFDLADASSTRPGHLAQFRQTSTDQKVVCFCLLFCLGPCQSLVLLAFSR